MTYFQLSEFDSPDLPGSGSNMDRHFLQLLDQMREEAGIPFSITSGYRTAAHNSTLADAVPDSAHTKGLAVDIACIGGRSRWLILDAAFKNGIKRIGIGATFVHVDIDATKPNPDVWFYKGVSG